MNIAITKYEIDEKGECWNFTGHIGEKGYGRVFDKGRKIAAHKWFYESLCGQVPKGMELDHICHNRKCVNPQHLEVVTHQENIKRSIGIRVKNHPNCINGHEFTKENTFYNKNGRKFRRCRQCVNKAQLEYLKRKRSVF